MKRLWKLRSFRFAAYSLAAIVVIIVSYCSYEILAGDAAERINPVTEPDWSDRIKLIGSITFRSWGGKWIGTDCDTEITFLAGHEVIMTEYGNGVLGARWHLATLAARKAGYRVHHGKPWRRDNEGPTRQLLAVPTRDG
jgi:hypothetical protein